MRDRADAVNDTRRLQEKLVKLATAKKPIGLSASDISAPGKDGALLAILSEIDETVMARLLVFRNGAGKTVELEVANRRLLRVADTSTQTMADTTLPGQMFSESGGPLVESLRVAFDDFLPDGEQVFVQSKKLAQAPDPTVIGCASETLAQLWSLDLYPSPETASAGLMEQFIATCADIATAWVQLENDAIEQATGPDEQVERLIEIVAGPLAEFDAGLNKHMQGSEATRCVTLGPQDETGDVVVYAKIMASGLLMVLSDAHLPDVISNWRSLQK